MAGSEPESTSFYLLKLVDIAQRQLDAFLGFQQAMQGYMAHTDQKFSQAADMFVQVGAWIRENGTGIARTNERLLETNQRQAVTNERLLATEERIEHLERQIEQLLRALLRGRGDGEDPTAVS